LFVTLSSVTSNRCEGAWRAASEPSRLSRCDVVGKGLLARHGAERRGEDEILSSNTELLVTITWFRLELGSQTLEPLVAVRPVPVFVNEPDGIERLLSLFRKVGRVPPADGVDVPLDRANQRVKPALTMQASRELLFPTDRGQGEHGFLFVKI